MMLPSTEPSGRASISSAAPAWVSRLYSFTCGQAAILEGAVAHALGNISRSTRGASFSIVDPFLCLGGGLLVGGDDLAGADRALVLLPGEVAAGHQREHEAD